MLRRLLDYQLSLTEKGKPLHKLRPLVAAGDTFLYEPPINTKTAPHIRDAIDVKRWMLVVVIALIPCIIVAIWNTGLQSFVYSSGDYKLMNEYLMSAHSFSTYVDFALKENRYLTILKEGLYLVIPLTILVYAVGGLWEAIFACVRKHPISEGFLVTGILLCADLAAHYSLLDGGRGRFGRHCASQRGVWRVGHEHCQPCTGLPRLSLFCVSRPHVRRCVGG